MEKWSVGVFASIDAGLGVQLEVARDLGIRTVQLHTPAKESRTPENASSFLKKLEEYGITVTCVFLGFEGESYETIAITAQTKTISSLKLQRRFRKKPASPVFRNRSKSPISPNS